MVKNAMDSKYGKGSGIAWFWRGQDHTQQGTLYPPKRVCILSVMGAIECFRVEHRLGAWGEGFRAQGGKEIRLVVNDW